MSLIHQALKKAERSEGARKPVTQTIGAYDQEGGKTSTPRTIVLIGLLVGASIFAIYMNFFNKPSERKTATTRSEVAVRGVGSAVNVELDRLKQSAERAFREGEYDHAWAMLTAAHKVQTQDPEILNNLGVVAGRRGEKLRAKEFFEQALAERPDYIESFNNLAVLEMENGDFARADELLSRALRTNPNYAEANFNLALLRERSGNAKEAVELYLKFLKHVKDVEPTLVDEVRRHAIAIQE